jgi:hypothetical protein
MDRKKLFAGLVALIAISVTVAYGGVRSASVAEAATLHRVHSGAATENSVVGGWHWTVSTVGSPVTFDTLNLFNPGGGFIRIDGRNNVLSLGVWTENTQNRVSCTFMNFTFDAAGHRTGTITVTTLGHVRNGVLSGSFSATGVDLAGKALPGFPKTGTYTAERIQSQAA